MIWCKALSFRNDSLKATSKKTCLPWFIYADGVWCGKQYLVFGENAAWRTNSPHLLLQLLQTSRAMLLWKDLCVPVMLAVFYIIFLDTLRISGPSPTIFSTQPVCQSHNLQWMVYHASSGVNEYNLMVLLLSASFIENNYVYVSNVQCQKCTGWQRCVVSWCRLL